MSNNSKDAILRQWQKLLKGIRENESQLAGIAGLREALEEAQAKVVALSSLRDALYASAMETTQELRRALAGGRDAAFCLGSYLKSWLGPRSAKLREFGLNPSHRRRPSGGKPGGEGVAN
jgi:hypothetical protein